eukprot:SM000075S21952  [mRNA]  locus=s75:221267:222800:+ [translate_table: standard]
MPVPRSCSVLCYRTHKEVVCAAAPPAVPLLPNGAQAAGELPLAATAIADGTAGEHVVLSPPLRQQPPRAFEDGHNEAAQWRLRRPQLEALAASELVQSALQSTELQNLVRMIDGAVDGEKVAIQALLIASVLELARAEESPLFRNFCQKVLAVVNPDVHAAPALLMPEAVVDTHLTLM